ncbi:MAG: hypothetical protein LBQ22_04705 [Bacteroidales bacterium]|jgi:hypothetical protein|nr:hypothetical protein [Bacteroidales bacterium]
MKNKLLIALCLLLCCYACEPEFGTTYTKTYEFWVENQFSDKTVMIVPNLKTNFWISPSESFIVESGQKIIIGSKIIYDYDKKATDIYNPNDIISLFDIYIDGVKLDNPFTLRKFWEFSLGKVNNSAKYTLRMNDNLLNSQI